MRVARPRWRVAQRRMWCLPVVDDETVVPPGECGSTRRSCRPRGRAPPAIRASPALVSPPCPPRLPDWSILGDEPGERATPRPGCGSGRGHRSGPGSRRPAPRRGRDQGHDAAFASVAVVTCRSLRVFPGFGTTVGFGEHGGGASLQHGDLSPRVRAMRTSAAMSAASLGEVDPAACSRSSRLSAAAAKNSSALGSPPDPSTALDHQSLDRRRPKGGASPGGRRSAPGRSGRPAVVLAERIRPRRAEQFNEGVEPLEGPRCGP